MRPACLSAGRRPPAAAALILLVAFGCGKPADLPVTHPVSGKVVCEDGRPLKGGTIEFVSSAPDPSISITGIIDHDGHFTLSTLKGNQKVAGAVEGQYRVTIIPAITDSRQPATPITLPDFSAVKPGKNVLPDLTIPLPPAAASTR